MSKVIDDTEIMEMFEKQREILREVYQLCKTLTDRCLQTQERVMRLELRVLELEENKR